MKSKKFPIQFIILTIITILPVIVSTVLFFNHQHFAFKTVNHGTLVKPVINVTDLAIGKPTQKKWRIVYISGSYCNDQCKKLSSQLNQIKKILNKDRDRTDVIIINDSYQALKDKFKQNNMNITNKVYLVDPIGNLFMYYSAETDPMNVLKDLQRVLEVSQIG